MSAFVANPFILLSRLVNFAFISDFRVVSSVVEVSIEVWTSLIVIALTKALIKRNARTSAPQDFNIAK